MTDQSQSWKTGSADLPRPQIQPTPRFLIGFHFITCSFSFTMSHIYYKHASASFSMHVK